MYVCGVTVYDYCHIGHARAYVVFDTLKRYLTYRGYKVNHVQNFTDIDDKILKRATEKGEPAMQLVDTMMSAYFTDMDALNISHASCYPRVTEHIPEIISFIEALIKKGAAYEVKGDVYFRVDKYANYGKLSKRNLEQMQAGARVEKNEAKDHPMDFALWKSDLTSEIVWDSPWGKGRPGWHIECSAMSRKYLGDSFDIHGGGMDLVFPHHENEIAQTEALTGKPMANYWIHNGFVKVNEEKMSKSLGNFFTIREVLKVVPPVVLRLFFLMTQYRMPINYSDQELKEVQTAYDRIAHALFQDGLESKDLAAEAQAFRAEFIVAMDDDLNTAKALAIVFSVVKALNATKAMVYRDLLLEILEVLGLDVVRPQVDTIPSGVAALAQQRWEAKQAKDWPLADTLRKQILEAGYIMEDGKDEYKLKKG
jgi:cysteinyl-tRNA synthetase